MKKLMILLAALAVVGLGACAAMAASQYRYYYVPSAIEIRDRAGNPISGTTQTLSLGSKGEYTLWIPANTTFNWLKVAEGDPTASTPSWFTVTFQSPQNLPIGDFVAGAPALGIGAIDSGPLVSDQAPSGSSYPVDSARSLGSFSVSAIATSSGIGTVTAKITRSSDWFAGTTYSSGSAVLLFSPVVEGDSGGGTCGALGLGAVGLVLPLGLLLKKKRV